MELSPPSHCMACDTCVYMLLGWECGVATCPTVQLWAQLAKVTIAILAQHKCYTSDAITVSTYTTCLAGYADSAPCTLAIIQVTLYVASYIQ